MSDIVILAIWLVFVLLSLGFFKLLTGLSPIAPDDREHLQVEFQEP